MAASTARPRLGVVPKASWESAARPRLTRPSIRLLYDCTQQLLPVFPSQLWQERDHKGGAVDVGEEAEGAGDELLLLRLHVLH